MAHARWCRINETSLLTRERLLYQVGLLYLNMVDLVCTISNVCISDTMNHIYVSSTNFSRIIKETVGILIDLFPIHREPIYKTIEKKSQSLTSKSINMALCVLII